ncbi:MAG: hypothetical protein PHZ16_03265 [Eubacteriales bacterium]|nr:hypothetical protein [Eubacteriales bacterium]MDD3611189.1 hypothetical protein [Eubacteriales bacterium]
MKRRLALLFFVAMFAILSCNYALAFFESDRDYIGSERKAKSFSPKTTVVAVLDYHSDEAPSDLAQELILLADDLDADLILDVFAPAQEGDIGVPVAAREYAPELTVFILSDQPVAASNYLSNQLKIHRLTILYAMRSSLASSIISWRIR